MRGTHAAIRSGVSLGMHGAAAWRRLPAADRPPGAGGAPGPPQRRQLARELSGVRTWKCSLSGRIPGRPLLSESGRAERWRQHPSRDSFGHRTASRWATRSPHAINMSSARLRSCFAGSDRKRPARAVPGSSLPLVFPSVSEECVAAGACSATRPTARCAYKSPRIRLAASASAAPTIAASLTTEDDVRALRIAAEGLDTLEGDHRDRALEFIVRETRRGSGYLARIGETQVDAFAELQGLGLWERARAEVLDHGLEHSPLGWLIMCGLRRRLDEAIRRRGHAEADPEPVMAVSSIDLVDSRVRAPT